MVDLNVFDIALNELSAIVMSVKDEANGLLCCSIRICLEERHTRKPKIMHALLQIEDKLRSTYAFPHA